MTLSEIWDVIHNNPGFYPVIIIIILSLVEVSKIKLNPWSALGKIIGKLLGVESVSNKLDALDKKVDENQATTIRVRILQFEDDLQQGKIRSKDSWDQVMDDIQRYEEYTKNHPEFKNNITIASTNHIKKKYCELLEKRAWTTTLNKEK